MSSFNCYWWYSKPMYRSLLLRESQVLEHSLAFKNKYIVCTWHCVITIMFHGYSATLYKIQYTFILEYTCRNHFLQKFYYKLHQMTFFLLCTHQGKQMQFEKIYLKNVTDTTLSYMHICNFLLLINADSHFSRKDCAFISE